MSKNLVLGLLAIMALCLSVTQAGTLRIVDLPATGTDDAIGISSGKTYTHTFDFGSNAPVTINGVAFDRGPSSTLSTVYTGTSRWGYGYTIDDTRRPVNVPVHAGNNNTQVDGNSNGLLLDMIYHAGGPVGQGTILTLSDLTPGTKYSTRWYYRPWVTGADRTITFEADGESHGTFSDTIDLNLDAGGAHYLDYTFIADDTDVTIRFITHYNNMSAHIYGLTNEVAEPVTRAYGPNPKDGVLYLDTWVMLSWSPGDYAASHNVYMADNFDDVNNGAAGAFRVNQPRASTSFLAGLGMPGDPYPAGLVPGTTYYWRIDEVNQADPNSPWKGWVWSFTIPPRTAYNPNPLDGARFIPTDTTLNWSPGLGTRLHYVYFGDSLETVAGAAQGGAPTGTASYTPAGPLGRGKTYYWRVDEFDGTTTYKGDVWSFETLPIVPVSDPNLVGWWKLDEGGGAIAVDWSGHDNNGLISNINSGLAEGGSVWDMDPERGMVLSFNGDNSTGAYVSAGGIPAMSLTNGFTWAFWAKQHQNQGTVVPGEGNNPIIGNRYSFTGTDTLQFIKFTPGRFEYYNDDPDYTMTIDYDDIPGGVWIHHAGVKDGTTLTYYRNGIASGTSTITKTIQANPFYMAGEPAGGGRWQGRLSDVRLYNKALAVEEIKQVMRGDPLLAWDPHPVNGATTYIKETTPLTWSPGDGAARHAVYFGTDRDAVNNADASDTTGVYRGQQTTTSYSPTEGVEWGGGPYYWRVDEIKNDGTITKGRVWSFTVADYVTVDDIESYNDLAETDPASNRIYTKWIDGYGTTTNGALVGNLDVPLTERSNVHGGVQAMPLSYDNNMKFSEATLTLTGAACDWTREGVGVLSLWFRGQSANAAERMYVALSGTAMVYNEDTSLTRKVAWTEWVIPLQQFADQGVNLANVTSITIGFGTRGNTTVAGDTGQMYFDDIRLYRPKVTP